MIWMLFDNITHIDKTIKMGQHFSFGLAHHMLPWKLVSSPTQFFWRARKYESGSTHYKLGIGKNKLKGQNKLLITNLNNA